MALNDTYVTTSQLKTRLGLTTTADDHRLDGAVATASRDVEQFCNRQFNKVDTASERMYYPLSPNYVEVDDFYKLDDLAVTVVELLPNGVTVETPLVDGEFQAEPLERSRYGFALPAPYWSLRNLNQASLSWPVPEAKGYLKVTAHWGWEAVPDPVKEATLILAEEYFKMKEAPFGVINWGEFGPVRVQENRTVRRMLQQYARGRVKLA